MNNIYFAQCETVSHADIRSELGTNRVYSDKIKRIKSGDWSKCSEAEKGFEQQKDCLTIHDGIIFRGVVPFIPPNLRTIVIKKAHEMQLKLQYGWALGGLASLKTYNVL